MIKKLSFLLFSVLFLNSCLQFPTKYSSVAPGIWRAVLKLEQKDMPLKTNSARLNADPNAKFEDVTKGELPFNFEVIYDTPDKFHIDIINAEERIRIDDITIGKNRRNARDTIHIRFPEYQSYISAEFAGGVMEGRFVIPAKGDFSIPFVAKFGQNHRFSTLQKPSAIDMTGNWETTFGLENEPAQQEKAIGQFVQKGNKLTGTFATETGDYRFLEGEVQGNKFYMSCFDGAHAFLFEGKILDNGDLIGSFQSGKSSKSVWEAKRNDNFKLRNAEELVKLKDGFTEAKFSFANPYGRMISLDDAEYKGKVKIVQIMGTWCPNCKDETRFLSDFVQKNKDVAVIGLAFERHKEKAKADEAIKNYKNVMAAPYEFVVAGINNKQEAAQTLGFLDKVMAFPTTVYIDKKNKVRKVYTGFYGPATKEHEAFKKEFEEFVAKLKAE